MKTGLSNLKFHNRSMRREELLTPLGMEWTHAVNDILLLLHRHGVMPFSWYGTIPGQPLRLDPAAEPSRPRFLPDPSEAIALDKGMCNRLDDYSPLPDAVDDYRYPWFLYWEIYALLEAMGPLLRPNMRLYDAGGTASLFTCVMASQEYEIHSVDLSPECKANGDAIAQAMGWPMYSHLMDMTKLDFPSGWFDAAFSVCVFEHLTHEAKQTALRETARVLKPGAVFGITFDFRNPSPAIYASCADMEQEALLNATDIRRAFLGTECFRLLGNEHFDDNGLSYLKHFAFHDAPYSFGIIFLQRV